MIDKRQFIKKLKKIRAVEDYLLFEALSLCTLEDIQGYLNIINRFHFREVIIETNFRNLEYFNKIKRLNFSSIILRLDQGLFSMLSKNDDRFYQKIKKIFKLHLQICSWEDLNILKRLEFISDSLHCKDIIISISDEKYIYLPFVLNAIPIIDAYYKKRTFSIALKNINNLYFKEEFPLSSIKLLEIEPSNTCNLACPFCPVGRTERKALPPMTLDTFKMVIDQFPAIPHHVNLWGRGEPFLNADFFMMVKYLKEKGNTVVAVSTNGHFLTKENIYKLIEFRLDKLIISLDSVKKNTYEMLRKDGNFDLVLNNLKALSKIKSRILAKPEVFYNLLLRKKMRMKLL